MNGVAPRSAVPRISPTSGGSLPRKGALPELFLAQALTRPQNAVTRSFPSLECLRSLRGLFLEEIPRIFPVWFHFPVPQIEDPASCSTFPQLPGSSVPYVGDSCSTGPWGERGPRLPPIRTPRSGPGDAVSQPSPSTPPPSFLPEMSFAYDIPCLLPSEEGAPSASEPPATTSLLPRHVFPSPGCGADRTCWSASFLNQKPNHLLLHSPHKAPEEMLTLEGCLGTSGLPLGGWLPHAAVLYLPPVILSPTFAPWERS